jgi:hypothetical protein
MQMHPHRSQAFLAGAIVVFLLAFSSNAYACLLPLSETSGTSMANGCSTPIERPARQLCDTFKTLGLGSGSLSSSLLVDHHLQADHAAAALPAVSHHFQRIFHRDPPLDMSSPVHQSLATTVLRI